MAILNNGHGPIWSIHAQISPWLFYMKVSINLLN